MALPSRSCAPHHCVSFDLGLSGLLALSAAFYIVSPRVLVALVSLRFLLLPVLLYSRAAPLKSPTQFKIKHATVCFARGGLQLQKGGSVAGHERANKQ